MDICREFFTYLNTNQVRYCHWKSTIRLSEGLNGKTDLDLLIHQNDKQSFDEALGKFDFKRILSPKWKRYPGVEDYIGFDRSTTALIHLHVHYNLVLGEKHLKGHHLRIEEYILKTRVFVDTMPVVQPEVELLLAIIRVHMKSEVYEIALNQLKKYLRPARPPYTTGIWEELVFLVKKTSPEIFRNVLRELNLPVSEQLFMDYLEKLSQSTISSHDILYLRQHIFERLRPFKRISPVHYSAIKAFIKLRTLPLMPALKNKKVLPETGRIIALVGADGSGKSTLVRDLQSWLSWKLSVRTVYFGIPESMVTSCVQTVNRVLGIAEKYLPGKQVKKNLRYIMRYTDAGQWIFIARGRLALFKKSRKLASSGSIVITDRYPLALFKSMDHPMDGPRLQSQAIYMPFAVNLEKSTYDQIGLPDRIFALQADFPALRKRKDNLDEQQHIKKVEAVNALKPSECIMPINVNRPYEDVLKDLKREIWRLL
ncbi:MAG: hypothetical protein JXM72_08375 [Deltaproteobacteria bacterium]|nr:hypothetical protein [Deltaproteobacteria bacterium]